MRCEKSIITTVLASIVALPSWSLLASDKDGNAPTGAVSADGRSLIYVPPRGVPSGSARVVATTGRDGNGPNDPPTLAVLSPDHVGLTLREQPSFFWFLSKAVRVPLIATLTRDGEIEPLLEVKLDGTRSGIQRLDLATQNVRLIENAQYEICLKLVYDREHHEHDVIASSIIKRVAPPVDLLAGLQKRPKPMERAILLARSGVWYDALSILSDQIDTDAADKASRVGRAALLDQVELHDVATFDRALASAR